MKTETRIPRREGFTLVELLVVVGIISLLVAILLPSLRRARDSAARVRCGSNERQLVQALTMYINENKGYLPPAPRLYYTPDIFAYTYDYGGWIPMIAPYAGQTPDLTTYAGYTVSKTSVFFCPIPVTGSWSAGYDYKWTYTMNHDLRTEKKITQVQFPLGRVMAFVESGVYGDIITDGQLVFGFYGHDYGPGVAGPAHFGQGGAIAYLDGHAEWYTAPTYADFLTESAKFPWTHTSFWGFRPETATTFSGLGGTGHSSYDP